MRKASLHRNKGFLYIHFFFAFGAKRKIVWGCKSTGNKKKFISENRTWKFNTDFYSMSLIIFLGLLLYFNDEGTIITIKKSFKL